MNELINQENDMNNLPENIRKKILKEGFTNKTELDSDNEDLLVDIQPEKN